VPPPWFRQPYVGRGWESEPTAADGRGDDVETGDYGSGDESTWLTCFDGAGFVVGMDFFEGGWKNASEIPLIEIHPRTNDRNHRRDVTVMATKILGCRHD